MSDLSPLIVSPLQLYLPLLSVTLIVVTMVNQLQSLLARAPPEWMPVVIC